MSGAFSAASLRMTTLATQFLTDLDFNTALVQNGRQRAPKQQYLCGVIDPKHDYNERTCSAICCGYVDARQVNADKEFANQKQQRTCAGPYPHGLATWCSVWKPAQQCSKGNAENHRGHNRIHRR